MTAGLVQHETSGAGKHLFERRAKQRRLKRLAALSNILYWKIPVFDPDRILTWMFRYLSWIFTTWFFVLTVSFMLAAAIHVMLHFDTFYAKLPAYHEFFSCNTVLYMWISPRRGEGHPRVRARLELQGVRRRRPRDGRSASCACRRHCIAT